MIKEEECCLVAHHYENNKKVYFLESVRIFKENKRPELQNKDGSFIQKRVLDAIQSPDFVYPDYKFPHKRSAHYLKEFKINNRAHYTKVILEYKSSEDCYFVITAFRPMSVKERGKRALLYGEDTE